MYDKLRVFLRIYSLPVLRTVLPEKIIYRYFVKNIFIKHRFIYLVCDGFVVLGIFQMEGCL